jgi:glycerophosphoryl diester phosphodiesterase
MGSDTARGAGRPIVLGHRGASAEAPENTMAAFRLALAQGADGFELDVWRCRSGEVVVLHDADARRTTGVPFHVARTPWSELRRLDAGSWKSPSYAGERLPLLGDVLDAFRSAVVNVELKSDGRADPRLAFAVAAAVRDHDAADRVVVSSFDLVLLAAFRAAAPRVRAGALFGADQRWRPRVIAAGLLGAAALHPEHALVTPERAAAWRARGWALNVWTVDDPHAIAALCSAGIDGVISNVPGRAREAVRRATGC